MRPKAKRAPSAPNSSWIALSRSAWLEHRQVAPAHLVERAAEAFPGLRRGGCRRRSRRRFRSSPRSACPSCSSRRSARTSPAASSARRRPCPRCRSCHRGPAIDRCPAAAGAARPRGRSDAAARRSSRGCLRCRPRRLVPASPLVPAVPVGALSTQLPLTQRCPEPQACPQLPQLASLAVEDRRRRCRTRLPDAVRRHRCRCCTPRSPGRCSYRLPQWFASDGTQEPLQSISPLWHWHWPP